MKIAQMAKVVEKFTADNSPLILTVAAVGGTITTALLAGKASYKAADIIRGAEESQPEESPLTPKEKVQLVWPLYVPAVGTGVMTVTCVIVAHKIGTRRAAAMAAAYTLSEKAFEEYREKIVEKMGANKERAVRDDIAQDRVNRTEANNTIFLGESSKVPFFDMYTGRYFESDMETVKQAQNNLNYQINNHQYASLNDFYDRLGLPHVKMGDEVGWNGDKLMDIHFTTTMSENGQKPCIAIDFYVAPVRNYFRTH